MIFRWLAFLIFLVNNSDALLAQLWLEQGGFETTSQWFSPTKGSPDFFHQNRTPMGRVPAFEGEHFAGMVLFDLDNSNFREYIAYKLEQPLKKGNRYCLEWYWMLAPQSHLNVDGFGVTLSSFVPYQTHWGLLPLEPIFQLARYQPLPTEKWVRQSFDFVAHGQETFLCMGNFKPDEAVNKQVVNPQAGMRVAYVYIDAVKLYSIAADANEKSPEPKETEVKFSTNPGLRPIIPTAITPNGDGVNDFLEIIHLPRYSQLKVFDKNQKLVYESNFYKNDWDGEGLADGQYDYTLTLPDGNVIFGYVHIKRGKHGSGHKR